MNYYDRSTKNNIHENNLQPSSQKRRLPKWLLIVSIAIFICSLLFIIGQYHQSNTSKISVSKKTAHSIDSEKTINAMNPRKAIEMFTDGKIKEVTFINEYNDPDWNGIVYEYKDTNGADFRVDKGTNRVVYYNAIGTNSKIGSSTTAVTAARAEEIGLEFAKKNIIDFDDFSRDATYTFVQDTAPKMNGQYVLNWLGKKPRATTQKWHYDGKEGAPPPYHSILVLDNHGNIISFQNEYITEYLGR